MSPSLRPGTSRSRRFLAQSSVYFCSWISWLGRWATLLVAVLATTFLVFSALPADPVRSALGANASAEAVARLRSELGLDRPLPERFIDYAKASVSFEFGRSYVTSRPVSFDLRPASLATASYVSVALVIAALLSVATLATVQFRSAGLSNMALTVVRLVTSLPSIVISLGIGMLCLSVAPTSGQLRSNGVNLALGASALAVYPTCSLIEILLTERIRIMQSTCFRAGIAFGFGPVQLFLRFVVREAFVPWLSQLSNVAASLVTGSVVIEIAFSLPGLGNLLARSVLRNDLPTMQAIVLTTVTTFLFVDGLSKWLAGRFNPPLR